MLKDCLKESELTIDRDTNEHLVVYINAIPVVSMAHVEMLAQFK